MNEKVLSNICVVFLLFPAIPEQRKTPGRIKNPEEIGIFRNATYRSSTMSLIPIRQADQLVLLFFRERE